MKRFLLVMATVTLLLMFASLGEAWEVRVKNSCDKSVNIKVTGEHLFWRQLDCEVTVDAGKTGTCQLPGAICPFNIYGTNAVTWQDLNMVHCSSAKDICCCWNVNIEVVQWPNKCWLELR